MAALDVDLQRWEHEVGERETHRIPTNLEARRYKKGDGQPVRLCSMGAL